LELFLAKYTSVGPRPNLKDALSQDKFVVLENALVPFPNTRPDIVPTPVPPFATVRVPPDNTEPFELTAPAAILVLPVPPLATVRVPDDKELPLDWTTPAAKEVCPVPPLPRGSVPVTAAALDRVIDPILALPPPGGTLRTEFAGPVSVAPTIKENTATQTNKICFIFAPYLMYQEPFSAKNVSDVY
jgi:hypothetical protein